MNIEQIQDEILEQNYTGKDEGFDAGYAAGYKAAMKRINKLAESSCLSLCDYEDSINKDLSGHGLTIDDTFYKVWVKLPVQQIFHESFVPNGNKSRFKGQTPAKKVFMLD